MKKNRFDIGARFNEWANSHKVMFFGVILSIMLFFAAWNCYRLWLASTLRVYTAAEQQQKELMKSRAIEAKGDPIRELYPPARTASATASHGEGEELDCGQEAVVAYSD